MKITYFYYLCIGLGSALFGFFVVSGAQTEKAAFDYTPKFSSGQVIKESGDYGVLMSELSTKAQKELEAYRREAASEFSTQSGVVVNHWTATEKIIFTFPEIPEFLVISENGWSSSGKTLIIKTEDIKKLGSVADDFQKVSVQLWQLAQSYRDSVASYTSEQKLYTFQQSVVPILYLLPYSQVSGVSEKDWGIAKKMAYGKTPDVYFWKSRNKAKAELFFQN